MAREYAPEVPKGQSAARQRTIAPHREGSGEL